MDDDRGREKGRNLEHRLWAWMLIGMGILLQ